eukprot:2982366-Rhodomonas_salina.1
MRVFKFDPQSLPGLQIIVATGRARAPLRELSKSLSEWSGSRVTVALTVTLVHFRVGVVGCGFAFSFFLLVSTSPGPRKQTKVPDSEVPVGTFQYCFCDPAVRSCPGYHVRPC